MNNKYLNPRLKQSEIASQLDMSASTIRRHRNDIIMLSPYRINPTNDKKRPKKAKIDDNGDLKYLKLLQMISRPLQTKQLKSKRIK